MESRISVGKRRQVYFTGEDRLIRLGTVRSQGNRREETLRIGGEEDRSGDQGAIDDEPRIHRPLP